MKNLILLTDSYKAGGHWQQYPNNLNSVYSYFESRGGEWDNTVFFGLQYILKEYFEGQVVTQEKIDEAEELFALHFGNTKSFNKKGWEYILDKHKGRLPVSIMAVPEGTVVPIRNVLMTVENTDPNCYWLTNYLETLLVQAWYPTTVCTQSREMKKIILRYLSITGDEKLIDFKLHDFGFRGVSSVETAGIGGCAHLVNFKGTDTLRAITFARKYYNQDMAGYSIPAAEHSTITSWGKDHETEAMNNMLEQYPEGLVAIVSDSFDIYNACENILGGTLRDKILNRNGTAIVRPDCYDEQTEILTDSGWKYFSDLVSTDLVAQYHYNHNIDFIKPIKIYNELYVGKMIKLTDKKKRTDLLVTPNHRMILYNQNRYEIQTANNLTKLYFPWSFLQAGGNSISSNLEKHSLTYLERLYIAFQADGSYSSKISKKPIGQQCIRFNFVKCRKKDRLENICKQGGFKYKISQEPSRPNNFQVYVWLDKLPSKIFDWINITQVSSNWCQEFIQELSYWDATRRSNTRIKYDTTVSKNADIVQQLSIIAGHSSYLSIYKDNRSEKFSDVYSLNIRTNSKSYGLQNLQINEIDYDGRVYCVQVPTGMIIIRRNNKVVVCGNSGDALEVLPKVFSILGEKFGYTTNNKGFKVLDKHIRVIQGDGIDIKSLGAILHELMYQKWSADNIAFGSGGGLLQKLNRDTQKFAFKCSSITTTDMVDRDVYKEPITDKGKQSKRGRLKLVKSMSGGYYTVGPKDFGENQLVEVFRDGKILEEYTLEEIREKARL